MNEFLRAFKLSFQYKYSLIAATFCSFMVAVLWGANISAVYPFIEVGLKKETMGDWIHRQVAAADAEIAEIEEKIKVGKDSDASPTQISQLENELELAETKREKATGAVPFIEKYLPSTPFGTVALLMALVLVGTMVKGVFLAVNMLLVARVGQRTTIDMQNMFFANTLDLELDALGETGTGDLAGRIRGETNTIGTAVMTVYGKMMREPLKMMACLAGAAFISTRLLILCIVVCPAALLILSIIARSTKRANKKAVEESAKLMNRLFQAITYIKVVKAFTMERAERTYFRRKAHEIYKKGMRITLYSAMFRITNEFLGMIMICCSVVAGSYLVITESTTLFGIKMCDEPMTPGAMMMFYGFLIGAADPVRKLADVFNHLQAGIVSAQRVFPLIDREPKIKDPENPVRFPKEAAPEIVFSNIRFSYAEGAEVLRGVDITIRSGETVAILGSNGAGKSTLINLLPRFYDPTEGSITVGGIDVCDFRLHDLRRNIGYVTQETMLFNASIADNIRYGSSRATDEEVIAASKQAHAHGFIEELSDGYETQCGEHARRLSGGQRQRISIARAILRNPKVLILDEATSAIDPESEVLIRRTLGELTKDRTTLMITHRLSTLDLADRILVMDQGKVLDFGTHDELMDRCPLYLGLRQNELRAA